jgi:hypothetical protein
VVHHRADVVPTRLPATATVATLSGMSLIDARRRHNAALDVRAAALLSRGLWRMWRGRAPWRAAPRRRPPQLVAMRWPATHRSRASRAYRVRWRRA